MAPVTLTVLLVKQIPAKDLKTLSVLLAIQFQDSAGLFVLL